MALHVVLVPGRGLHLWVESPASPDRDDVRRPHAHPHALDGAALARRFPGTTPGETTLLLPSGADGPAPSDGAEPADRLARWMVPTVAVAVVPRDAPDAAPALAVLGAVDDLAADLVRRGRLLPAPAEDRALRWRPVLQGPDLVAADTLTAALPPAARAAPDPATGAVVAASAVVTEVLADAVDRHARARLAGTSAPGWLAALVGDDAGGGPRPDGLTAGLGRWSVVGAPHAGPARAAVRLSEVVVDDLGHALDEPAFRLELALAAAEDPSLVVPAATVLRDPSTLRRWLDDPAATLLAELDRAAATWPALADLLPTGGRPPGEVSLDLVEAHAFLTDGADVLLRAGFVVELPSTWVGAARLGLVGQVREEQPAGTTGVVVVRPSPLGREQLVDRSWLLAVDGEPLRPDELAALARAKAPLVRRHGTWVALDPARLRAAIAFLDARGEERVPVAELLGGDTAAALPLPVERLDADGDVGALLAGLPERLAPVAVPEGVRVALRPYQRHGLAWLVAHAAAGLGGVLADDMGLGKTLQVLALEAYERAEGDPGPTLVVCPTTVITTWVREAARCVPDLRVGTHHGAARGDLGDTGSLDLVVTSYGTLVRDVETLRARRWRRVVLDEAQHVKNPRSRAARAVRALPADHALAVTGTPVENRLSELWALLDAVVPGLLGGLEEFRERVAVPIERHGREDVAADLRARVRPVLLRRRKADVAADLPPKIESVERCGLTREQATLYEAVVGELVGGLERERGPRRRRQVLAALTRLKQVCDHPALMLGDGSSLGGRSGKLRRVEELLADLLAEGERVLLFTQYAAFGHLLAPHLRARLGADVAWLHGATPRRARDAMIERFQRGEGPPLFLLSLRAGGTGITLTGARHVVHLDRWWNPAVEDQATDRAHRIGQDRTVHVRRMVCAGTIEERIEDMLDDKRALAETVLGTRPGDDAALDLAALDDAELLRAVALDPEQVEQVEQVEQGGDGGDGTGVGDGR